jgi:uncharacterized damage-inducible protein DinB
MAHDTQVQSLAARGADCLGQADLLVSELDDARYASPRGAAFSASIGSHVRHVLDYYRQFLDGLLDGHVDYEARRRDSSVETDRAAARAAIGELAQRLRLLSATPEEEPLTVRVESPAGSGAARADTSVARELDFLLSHAIHHFAIVAIVLRVDGYTPPADFGVAPSTLRHWRQTGRPCAQ